MGTEYQDFFIFYFSVSFFMLIFVFRNSCGLQIALLLKLP